MYLQCLCNRVSKRKPEKQSSARFSQKPKKIKRKKSENNGKKEKC